MPTYVSIVEWYGRRRQVTSDVRDAVRERSADLRACGMHSLAFLPDEGACAAVMVSTCRDDVAAERIATSILPDAMVRVESMLFEDGPGLPAWISREVVPPPPRDFRRALLHAITSASEA